MRRLLSFDCDGAALGASLDEGSGTTGLLMVVGGSQTRIGSHRMYERLAHRLAAEGLSCLRYDRRGVGDSEGTDPGYLASGPDIAAAAAAFRAQRPGLDRMMGFGLCDGATALALFGRAAGLDGIILVNPWLVEAASDTPPPAAIKAHYRQRLTSLSGWKKLLSGQVDIRKLLKGVAKISAAPEPSTLAGQVADALGRDRLPVQLVLARNDGTAIAAASELEAAAFKGLITSTIVLETDSHTFARPGDESALLGAVLAACEGLQAS